MNVVGDSLLLMIETFITLIHLFPCHCWYCITTVHLIFIYTFTFVLLLLTLMMILIDVHSDDIVIVIDAIDYCCVPD